MRMPSKQRGMGWFGFLFMFALIGFTAIVVIKCFPLYMNQMKLARAISGVAGDPELSSAEGPEIRNKLQRRWDIDDIILVEPKDIKIVRTERGRTMSYDYEARTNLFYNIFIVIHFKDEVPMRNASNG